MSPLNLQWHVTTKPTAVTKYSAFINQWIHKFQALHFSWKIIKMTCSWLAWQWQRYIIIYGTEGKDWETSEGILLYWTAVQLADHGWRQEHHESATHYNWSLNIYIYIWPSMGHKQCYNAINLQRCNLIVLL